MLDNIHEIANAYVALDKKRMFEGLSDIEYDKYDKLYDEAKCICRNYSNLRLHLWSYADVSL